MSILDECIHFKTTEEELKSVQEKIDTNLTTFKTNEEIDSFLLSLDLEKDLLKRLIAYMRKFNLIDNFDDLGSKFVKIFKDYEENLYKFLPDVADDPLKMLEGTEHDVVIMNDLPRSFPYFQSFVDDFKIDVEFLEHNYHIIKRILVILYLKDKKKFSYTQGFDRIVFITYTMGLHFTQSLSLSPKFAECIAFVLAEQLIYMTNMESLLTNPSDFYPINLLNYKIYKIRPDIADSLARLYPDHHYTIFFAIKWRLLLFMDDHKPKEVFLILDQFVMRLDDVDRYFFCLALAHIKQAPNDDPASITEQLQDTSHINVLAAIEDANDMYRDPDLYSEDPQDEIEVNRLTELYHPTAPPPVVEEEDEEAPHIKEMITHGVEFLAKGAANIVTSDRVRSLPAKAFHVLGGWASAFAKKSADLFNPFVENATPIPEDENHPDQNNDKKDEQAKDENPKENDDKEGEKDIDF